MTTQAPSQPGRVPALWEEFTFANGEFGMARVYDKTGYLIMIVTPPYPFWISGEPYWRIYGNEDVYVTTLNNKLTKNSTHAGIENTVFEEYLLKHLEPLAERLNTTSKYQMRPIMVHEIDYRLKPSFVPAGKPVP